MIAVETVSFNCDRPCTDPVSASSSRLVSFSRALEGMDEPQSSQDDVPKSKFTYRNLNALSSMTPPKENPLRLIWKEIF